MSITYPAAPACRSADPELFFPEDETGEEVREQVEQAKRICQRCPVRVPCRAIGMAEPVGIWGGMTGRERRLHLRQLRTGELSLLDLDELTA
ncbi:WhiB family transcriptional regulator [Pseudonocardia dioxanivorans]|uniref:WhiB family transcriptional regulator n=1 Tax=Pseudonocardia dioxanivorans TaxID=240495 RepID=UPI0018F87110|nr:WhiB family transcriptional regulator [Pseudonocardia dioxanivorans]